MYRIAIASSDGENIDLHFGQAPSFLIYEIREDGTQFVEDREVVLPEKDNVHTGKNIEAIIELLDDCSAVFILRIGMQSARHLYAKGIKYFEVNYPLNHIFNTLIDNMRRGRVKIL